MKPKARIGKSIESLGNILMILIFLGGLVAAYFLVTDGQTWLAVAVILGSFALAYISTLFIRGFGRLVDNTDVIREKLELLTWNKDVMAQVAKAAEAKAGEPEK